MNFEVYKATTVARTYLVVSHSAVRRGQDPPRLEEHFTKEPALTLLVQELQATARALGGARVPVTIKVHGFNTRRTDFETEVILDADPALLSPRVGGRKQPAGFSPSAESFRPGDRFLIGFRWPSEGIGTSGSLRDTLAALRASPWISIPLLALPLLGLLASGHLVQLVPRTWSVVRVPMERLTQMLSSAEDWWELAAQSIWPPLAALLTVLIEPFRTPPVAALLLGAGALLLALRLSTYHRDRYRALHYGVPDFGEFMRTLEDRLAPQGVTLALDVIGHSMGALLLINAFRVMSDYFHAPPTSSAVRTPPGSTASSFPGISDRYQLLGSSGTYLLRTLLLCAPDIPAAMAVPERNNYFLSVLRRFNSVHIFSSDRDIILKWLSSFANWTMEPRYDMAGRKLGNVFLAKTRPLNLKAQDSRVSWSLCPLNRPAIGYFHVYPRDPVTISAPAVVNFHDCSLQPCLSGTAWYSAISASLIVSLLAATYIWLAPSPLIRWLAVILGVGLGLGALSQPLWPLLRDHGGALCSLGLLAEWTALTTFLTFGLGWNAHGGYFAFGYPPRQRISALLRDPSLFPRRDPNGQYIEELDESIRYRLVRVSLQTE